MTTDVAVIEDVPVRHFNPNDHIMQIPNKGGKSDYLPVQWRLVWFRELCPQGTIETQEIVVDLTTEFEGEAYVWNQEKKRSEKILKRAPGYARFRAIVHDGKGGFATATKTEKGVDFSEFVEKAETGAVGRAEEERIVDAPVERKPARSYQERKPFVEGSVSVKEEPNMATEQQLASIRKLLQHLGKPEPVDHDKMTYLDAKTTIVALSQEYKDTREPKPVLQTVPAQPQAQDAEPEAPPTGNMILDDMPPSGGQLETIRQLALHLGARIQKPKTFKDAAQLLDSMQSDWDQMKSRGRAS